MTDNITNRSGGVDFNAAAHIDGDAVVRDKNVVDTGGGAHIDGNVTVGGKFVGRDDHSTTNIYEASVPIATAFHQLPAPPLDFVGRTTELNAILNNLQHGAVITGLRGLGGIGKTTLALVIAERMKDQYPDAQFYIDLHGASDHPLSPAEALAHVIRAYHPTAKLPEGEAELRGLYCSVLNDQRALILLDDARDVAQVRPLLPPARSACLLLITSRQHFALPGLHATDLDTLPAEDARKLLLEIAPRLDTVTPHRDHAVGAGVASREAAKQSPLPVEIASPPPSTTAAKSTASAHALSAERGRAGRDASRNDVASEIAYFCGYLPQALRAAGSLLAVALDLDPLDYAAQLRDERTRLERLGVDPAIGVSVEASLNLSYALLSPEAQRVFGQLSVFPASFDAAAEEVICADEGHRHLSTLLQLSLAQYNTATKRYSLHDLVRFFALKHADEEERTSTQRRHAEYYSQVFGNANQMLLKGSDTMMSGLALFDTEWPNIQQGQKWSQEHTNRDKDAAKSCNWYGWQGHLLDLRFHPRERIRWMMAALDAARTLKNREAEGAHLGNLGLAYADLGETRKAIEFYEQHLVIAREISAVSRSEAERTAARRGEGNALGNLGNAYADLGETRQAIEFYEQALPIFREIGDRRGEGQALGNLGSAYADLGETRQAIEFHEQALAVMRDIGDKSAEGSILGNLGNAYANLGNAYANLGETRQAIEFYEQQLKIVREIGDRRGEGNALWNMALALDKLGEREKAIAYAEAALKIFEQIENPHADMVRRQLAKWKNSSQSSVVSGQKKKWWQVWK